MKIIKDIMNKTPEIGDIITFNPPYKKGLLVGRIVAFSTGGRPCVISLNCTEAENAGLFNVHTWINYDIKNKGHYGVKADFAIVTF